MKKEKKEKEDDSWKKALRNQITKIKAEGTKREEKYSNKISESKAREERYKKDIQTKANTQKQLEHEKRKIESKISPAYYKNTDYDSHTKRINQLGVSQKYLEEARQKEKREQFKQKVYKAGSRIESGVHRALESATTRLGHQLKQRVIARKILKPNKMEVHIRERVPESNWTDKNIFFKDNYQKEKRSMILE